VPTLPALSLKQPWAALLAHGRKTVEVRRWPTRQRGRVLIHAAWVPDERPAAWALVPPELRDSARLRGGVIGVGELTGCVAYRSRDAFAADRARHLNDPAWFAPPALYGFTFAGLAVLPFRRCPGWMRFFEVEWDEPTPAVAAPPNGAAPPKLLVSVRSAAEAEAALAGGADLIDVKEPKRGSLGAADARTLAAVVAAVAGRRPVSAALGELRETFWKGPPALPGLAYVKWGLAGFRRHVAPLWQWELTCAVRRLAEVNPACRAVAVAYADWERALAPPPDEVLALAAELRLGAFLLDTWGKDGTTLLDWLPAAEVGRLCERGRSAGLPVALGGSLGPAQVAALAAARPDWFAVRGAACRGGDRAARVEAGRVRQLAELLARRPAALSSSGG
jgi:(5-formylfuran-3-yl)methyl phosphate synthase